jgi:predicted RNase H-like HicB family nuclease
MSRGVDPATILTKDDGWWIAKDTETGVSSQGRTREHALDNLDEALDGYHGDGDEPADEDLQEMEIDPADNQSGSLDESPIFD